MPSRVWKQADAPQNKESAPPEQSKREKTRGRKSAVLSDFRGKGDKECHPSGENRNMGIYCGKNEVLSANVRGSPQKRNDKQAFFYKLKSNIQLTYKLYQLWQREKSLLPTAILAVQSTWFLISRATGSNNAGNIQSGNTCQTISANVENLSSAA